MNAPLVRTAAEAPGGAGEELEREVVGLFVRVADLLGLPRSIGELYGLLFITIEPLPMDALMTRLGLSKGATSQGLKLLRSFDAVKTVYVAGDRRDHFVAEVELRRLVAGFLKEKARPHLEGGAERLERIKALVGRLPPGRREPLSDRVVRLARWRRRATQLLPAVLRLIQT